MPGLNLRSKDHLYFAMILFTLVHDSEWLDETGNHLCTTKKVVVSLDISSS